MQVFQIPLFKRDEQFNFDLILASIKITFDGHPYSFERGYAPDFENSMNLLIQRILPIVTDSLYKLMVKLATLTNEIIDPKETAIIIELKETVSNIL